MAAAIAESLRSLVVLVDMQPSFLKGIFEEGRIRKRAAFLLEIAKLLEIPVFATEQNPERMGASDPELMRLAACPAIAKMTFSCIGPTEFEAQLDSLTRNQAVLTGIETHICVNQTAHGLLAKGYEVIVCADAVGARTSDRHELGLSRLRDAGCVLTHSEAVAYEWMKTAEHPQFREALEIVKRYGP